MFIEHAPLRTIRMSALGGVIAPLGAVGGEPETAHGIGEIADHLMICFSAQNSGLTNPAIIIGIPVTVTKTIIL